MIRSAVVLLTLNVSVQSTTYEPGQNASPSSSSIYDLRAQSNTRNPEHDGSKQEVMSNSEYDGSTTSWPTPVSDQTRKAKPMQTLEKLQEMLDDTDYLTNRRPLWTSRDRSKYKKQQQKFRQREEEEAASSDDTTDDGLGYTLPDLPIYNSDVEEESNTEDQQITSRQYNQQYRNPSRQSELSARQHSELGRGTPAQRETYYQPRNPNFYQPPPSGSYQTPYQYQQPSPRRYNGYYYPPQYPQPGYQTSRYQSYPYQPPPPPIPKSLPRTPTPKTKSPDPPRQEDSLKVGQGTTLPNPLAGSLGPYPHRTPSSGTHSVSGLSPPTKSFKPSTLPEYDMTQDQQFSPADSSADSMERSTPETLAEASTKITIWSMLKISHLALVASVLAYVSVSPRTLPLTEYNLKFYENLRLVFFVGLAPAVYMFSVFDARLNDINAVAHAFFSTVSIGYLLAFAMEILSTTVLRLLVFCAFEPAIFSLAPQVPIPVLPWALKDQRYRPKRITILVADFVTSCVLCPIIEESLKLMLLQLTVKLPKNFRWLTKKPTKSKRRRRIAEPLVRLPGQGDCVNANSYITGMLSVSLAMKLADATRRVLLYTKANHANKGFYAIFRGLFPIHELCGTMTALALAKRDLLGFHIPIWKLLAPAVVVHGMANFRGKKPIFKWNSAAPWSEMQLSPLNVPDTSSFFQLLKKGYGKLMWLIILSRVFGYCVKNYYLVNRQAIKRTTKYAGNHAAFFAELTTAETLKTQRKK